MMKRKKKRVNISIDPYIHEKLKELAENNYISVSQ